MLILTATAATLVRDIAAKADMSTTAGLRMDIHRTGNSIVMSLATEPASADELVLAHGARVFLTPAAAGRLTGRTLDAQLGQQSAFFFAESQ